MQCRRREWRRDSPNQRFAQLWVLRQAQIVVGAEIDAGDFREGSALIARRQIAETAL